MIWVSGVEYGTAAEVAQRLGSGVTDATVRRWHYTRGLSKHRMHDENGRPKVVFPIAAAAEIERQTRESPRGKPRGATQPSQMWVHDSEYVSTAEAARRLGDDVTTEMIHDWVKRGLLKPAGRYGGGSNIYRFLDVAKAERDTRVERRGRTRRGADLQKISAAHNLRTEAQVYSAQDPAERPRCIVADDEGRSCRNPVVIDAPFDICRSHMRDVYTFWRDNLAAICGVQDELPLIPEPRQPEPQDRPSFIYYIRFGDRIKIGFTVDVRTRLTALPFDELLAVEPGPPELERMRHHEFAPHRLRGEWFREHPDLLAHIEMLVSHYGTAESQLEAIGRPVRPRSPLRTPAQ